MKKMLLIMVLILVIPELNAQKKEINRAQQEIRAGNYSRAVSLLNQAKRIFAVADNKTRADYYVTEAELFLVQKPLDVQQIELVTKSLKIAKGYELNAALKERISRIDSKINSLSANIAKQEFLNKNYSNAALFYEKAFEKAKDTTLLLKAAKSHLLAKSYQEAFSAYTSLINMGYTNATAQYVATNVKTNKKDAFPTKEKRNKAIAKGLYKNPEIITTNSKIPEILRGITVSSIELNKKQAAIAFIDRTLAKMPENKMLLQQLSHLYIKLDAHSKYNALIDQLIKDNPSDVNLYYNAALSSAQNKEVDRAYQYYKKALEIKPDFINAQVNICKLLIEKDKSINDKMNELGDSESDDIRYKELQLERNSLYNELLPYLEQIVKTQPNNKEFTKKLNNIYNFKGDNSQIAIEREENK